VVATLSFGLAAAVTMVLVPIVRSLGLRFELIDQPDPRKQHNAPMVRLGGIAMVAGFGLSLSVIWLLVGFGLLAPARDQLIWSTLAGSLCFFLIGLADDLFDLSPWPRLAGQFAVACVIWSQGVRIGAIDLPWVNASGSAIVLSEQLNKVK
jgi:UDP-N-acetylmuramyl pentapeptide phosphotransferase/UDP-N-acetylglucosamine-1-phosphate transferase